MTEEKSGFRTGGRRAEGGVNAGWLRKVWMMDGMRVNAVIWYLDIVRFLGGWQDKLRDTLRYCFYRQIDVPSRHKDYTSPTYEGPTVTKV